MSSSMNNLVESEQQQPMSEQTRGGFFAPLKVRNFQSLFAGQIISTLGDTLLAALVQAVAVAIIPFSGGLIGAMLCLLLMGICNSITNVLFITLVQENLPRAQLGHLMGVILFASFGTYPISVLLTGILINHTGPAIMFPISGAFLALGASFGLFQREIRKL